MKKNRILSIVILINLLIFSIVNIAFQPKYEQVDDFIIYNLYSGLDGTYNVHGIYIHPVICMIIGLLFKIISAINWHSVFLLVMQFICFTIIGYLIIQKHKSVTSILIYTIFASIFYTALLLLIQYTSVAALLILTAFYILINKLGSNKWFILSIILYTIGVMTRMQSILIIIPFFVLYLCYYLIEFKLEKETITLIKKYVVLVLVTVIVYISNLVWYSDPIYKIYNEYNNLRAHLHDLSYTDYNTNKEIFNKINWSKNDHYLFYTVNLGDENVFNKDSLQQIINYKIQKGTYYNLNLDINDVLNCLKNELFNSNSYIALLFFGVLLYAVLDKENRKINIAISITTLIVHILFIVLGRSVLRVIIPEYILGTALIIYNLKINVKENDLKILAIVTVIISIIIVNISGIKYNFDYSLKSYSNYKQLIEYTNSHKENVYLYTVPSLQYRYLAYSVYEMPPKYAFSNLRVMGGWDMYTENYYDFKDRYNLEGTFLDLLKDNVYLIDGDVIWSGKRYTNYIDNVVLFIKEHYNIDVKYEKINSFSNLYIYKFEKI